MLGPILRYPGNKWRFRAVILARLARYEGWTQFREPFVGAGAIGIAMIAAHPRRDVWINDLDTGTFCVWKALRDHPDLLTCRVRDFVPSIEAYAQIRAYLRSGPMVACDHDVVHVALCKLALHCLSFSGIGLAGGPQRNIGKKWSPGHLCEKIARLQHYVRHIRITTGDYSELILDELGPALLYLDPPYVGAGPRLYAQFFANDWDHVELARLLRHTRHQWVLSYDDSVRIRQLYQDWTDVDCIPVRYMIQNSPVLKTELLISSKLLPNAGG